MLYPVFAYFKFLKKATNQHGVHSPFVYRLVTTCFYDREKYSIYNKICEYKNYLLSKKDVITVTDLGSGSRVFKSNKRSIRSMAKNAGASKKEAKLLFRLSQYFQFKTSLELGTSLGITTHSIHLGNPKNKITTVEGCPDISLFTKETFLKFNLKNTEIRTGEFSEIIKTLTRNTYDLIYFDGNHQKEATLSYFETLLPTATNDSVFIFDDIYWSKGMTEAWEIIKLNPKVTVTVDTYFWGIAFFRQEQAKEHFTIRV